MFGHNQSTIANTQFGNVRKNAPREKYVSLAVKCNIMSPISLSEFRFCRLKTNVLICYAYPRQSLSKYNRRNERANCQKKFGAFCT